ncbi:MAG: DUF354 domain-containing protein [Thermoproteota archaeon]
MRGNRIMIDILTPKQALLFGKVRERLEKRCKVWITSRRYIELNNIFKLSQLRPIIMGEHGGGDPYGKLRSYISRINQLSKFVKNISPDLVLSFSSPEAARVAFGLGIRHVSVNDSPHSEYVARLTIPLSCKLLTPKIVGKDVWLRYGIERRNIVVYSSLDPVAWLKDFTPDKSVLDKYALYKGEYIVYRPEEYRASYLNVRKLTIKTVSEIYHKEIASMDLKLVIVPRYEKEAYSRLLGKNRGLVILDHGEDTRSILFYSRGFIGAGGTMNAEASLLGVPTISLSPSNIIVEKYLVRKGLLSKASNKEELRRWLKKTVAQSFDEGIRASCLRKIRRMEDPAKRIAETCLSLL